MQTRRALIFANGEQIYIEAVRSMILPDDFLVAADGGLKYLNRLNLVPDLVIGDLDSVSAEEIDRLRSSGVRIEQFPVHKDETDLELAIQAVLRAGCRAILILGALGGRLDMTLANLFLLGLPELEGVDVRLEDGIEEVFLIQAGGAETGKALTIHGQPGDRVSLLPLGGPAHGVQTSGLAYPLRNESLYPERTRGISNILSGKQGAVSLASGRLIAIHTRQVGGDIQFEKE